MLSLVTLYISMGKPVKFSKKPVSSDLPAELCDVPDVLHAVLELALLEAVEPRRRAVELLLILTGS